jgi:hypothetical protein
MSESEAIDSLIPQRWWRGIPISEGVASFVRGEEGDMVGNPTKMVVEVGTYILRMEIGK